MIFRIKHNKEKKTSGQKHQITERFERKFFIPPQKTEIARSLMSHICLPDGDYPENTVNSLYFDTPDLDRFQESINGSYKREKIRIRWYDCNGNQNGEIPVFVELKFKRGYASKKQRRKILVPAENLGKIRGGNTIVSRSILLRTLSEFGYFSEEFLQPVIWITYKRLRFTEIMTGMRLSFDSLLRSTPASPWMGHSETGLMLEGGIIEIKGPSIRIPESLRSISILGTDWSRFSKYASCLESHMEKPGCVGRLCPSGRTKLL
jgi:hypothetical protein